MVSTRIPVLDLSPEIDALWVELMAATERVLRSGQFIMGPEVRAFEEEVGAYLGVKHAIGVNSGTDALVIGLRALGIGSGDEVLTTPFSFFATAESISNVGARPVFVDIEADSFNLNPDLLEAHITERTRAIMPVHLFGRPANMDAIRKVAEAHDLLVLEDCAQSFGARYEGVQTGAIGDVGAFSFFPTKNLGGFGDGGLITTNDDTLAAEAGMLRKHGAYKKYHNEKLGYNSRLDALQAALLRVKLPHLEQANAGRRRVAQQYNQHLADLPGLILPEITPGHVFHQYTIRILDGRRDEIKARLAEEGVSSMVYYPIPQDQLPVYKGTYPPCPVSEQMAREVLSLPIWPSCDEEVISRVSGVLRSALG